MIRPLRTLIVSCLLVTTLRARAQRTVPPLNDPANLAGERVSPQALADDLPIDHGAAALEQLLRKLRTRASLMLIVAHPDDEDSGLLTFASRGAGARVAMLTLTRGEGGQNLMSGDFDDALGLIRTQELLGEDRYTGVDQMFGTEVDFGFSKTKQEAFAKWTHERVLYDAVRAVRLYRPLVLASVFVGGPTDGHGHHQVAGEIAQEVFKAAADPSVFPEMIQQGLLPWAPLKVYARVPFSRVTATGMYDYATGRTIPLRFENYVTGAVSTTPPVATVTIHEGETPNIPAFHGMSYVQWARQGLGLQKSQIGPNVRVPPAGVYDAGYTLMGSRVNCTRAHQPKTACPTQTRWVDSADLPRQEDSLFAGIDVSLPGLADLMPGAPASLSRDLTAIDAKLAEAQQTFDAALIARTAAPLHAALEQLDGLIKRTTALPGPADARRSLLHELLVKRVQLNDALVLALGLTLEPSVKPLHTSYSDPLRTSDATLYANAQLTAKVSRDGPAPLTLKALYPQGSTTPRTSVQGVRLEAGKPVFAESVETYRTPPAPTRPYFSRPDLEQPFYDIAEPALRNAPATPDPLVATALVDDGGVTLEIKAVVPDEQSLKTQQLSPERRAAIGMASSPLQAAVIIPPVSLKLGRTSGSAPFTSKLDLQAYAAFPRSSSKGILAVGAPSFQVGAQLSVEVFEPSLLGPARIGPEKIPVRLTAPAGWQVSAATFNPAVEPVLEHFTVTPVTVTADRAYGVSGMASFASRTYNEAFRPVGYPGLTYTNFYTPATYKVVAVPVKTAPELRIAYLPGTGDDVPAYLTGLGLMATVIDPAALSTEDLSRFDAIVLGVRAYAAHPELAHEGSAPLNAYAARGGVVIVQYNSGGSAAGTAPYPYDLPGDSAHNVVEEEQPVTILAPDAPLLRWPNRIGAADFDHWVAERGHGFASTWAPAYQALLEMHDAGQDPQRGGLLVAPVGQGAYIYCALALYRQLPEAVPGAYRLFANLLSYAKNPERKPAPVSAADASH